MKRAFTSFLNHLQNVNDRRGARKQTVGCLTDVCSMNARTIQLYLSICTAVSCMIMLRARRPRRHACMKLLLQTAAWHAHAGCACVHGGSRIDPDVNGHQKAFQRVHDGGAQGPSSSGSWWPLSAPLCLTRAILSISTISKAHRQLVRRSILDADRPTTSRLYR